MLVLVLELELELELELGQALQAAVSGPWVGLEWVLALDLEQGWAELELDLELELELVLDHFQGPGPDHLLAVGQLEEPWALLPLLEPWASLELRTLDYSRTFRAITASSRWAWASRPSMPSGRATTSCGTQHALCVVTAANCWWT